jgi:tetratricopeptide (TPR) repeat protein
MCQTGKARRTCHRQNGANICSTCCASIRDLDCGDCIHYTEAKKHDANRQQTSKPPTDHFLLEVNPEVDNAVNTALEIAQQGEPSVARACLLSLWPQHPRSYALAFGMGVTYAIQGTHNKALEWFDQAIAINPYGIEAHYNKACAHQKQYELVECARAYQKVITLGSPDDLEVSQARSFIADMTKTIFKHEGLLLEDYLISNEHFNHAFELMENNEWQRALKSFRASAALHERNASCHGNMGICLAHLGQKAAALAELNRALEINPSYEPALSNRLLVEAMQEGHPMKNIPTQSTNYTLEDFLKKKH